MALSHLLMKIFRKLLVSLAVIAVLALGVGAYTYYSVDESNIPNEAVTAMSTSIEPSSYLWKVPVFSGLMTKTFERQTDIQIVNIGTIDTYVLPITPPIGYKNIIKVYSENKEIFNGDEAGFNQFEFPENGDYSVEVISNADEIGNMGSGTFHFNFEVTVDVPPPPPEVLTTKTTVEQGDVFAIKINNLSEAITPTAETELGMVTFTKQDDGSELAYVPISCARAVGNYNVTVKYGDETEQLSIKVVDASFEKQHLKIDTSNPVISEASSPKAYKQFRDEIYPIYEIADKQTYWKGNFIQPVEGRITTQFGMQRFTNGSTNASHHAGLDIANATGTPIVAPADGRVVFSKYLLNTGNTMAIEHGGGLKTFYFHMDSRSVEVGDIVKAGQGIGAIGTTGYSTGPHLHFETRIGNQSINPWNLINGTGGFFEIDKGE